IVRIDSHGIKAVSIFWKRKIKWEELADYQLTKVIYTQNDADNAFRVSYVHTKIPETKTEYGMRVQTFLVVSKNPIKTPPDNTLFIFSHKHIAAKDSIAFEYS